MGIRGRQTLIWIVVALGLLALVAGGLWLDRRERSHGAAAVRLNEVLSSNSAYPDPQGQYRDFIELYNPGDTPADLGGWGLTDNGRSVKYTFPRGTTVPAGGYLVVWCDADAPAEAGCAPFSISRDGGETIALLSSLGTVLDSVDTLPGARNRSLVPEGESWVLGQYATPGYENSDAGYAAYLSARSSGRWDIQISELMSANSLYPAPDGEYRDWIELRNSGNRDFDLSGCGLSDAAEELKYSFPQGVTVPAGGYAVVWCGLEGGPNFGLSRQGGETLRLLSAAGDLMDQLVTPALDTDCSWAQDESGVWGISRRPTPGYANSEAGFAAYLSALGAEDCPVILSEIMADNQGCLTEETGGFPDWIELYNPSDRAWSLTGYWLSDDPEDLTKWAFPETVIGPGEYLTVFCGGEGPGSADFSLSRFGETVCLSSPAGSLLASLGYERLEADRSVLGDGTVTDRPTPGFENSEAGYAAFLSSRTPAGPLMLSELMPANDRLLRQPDGNYYDWAELRNISGEPVSLAGWSLSDDAGDPGRFVFSEGELAPGAYVTVLLGVPEDFRGTCPGARFALSAEEDWLYLYSPQGALTDFVHVCGVPEDCSLGRRPGENAFTLLEPPSPGAENVD